MTYLLLIKYYVFEWKLQFLLGSGFFFFKLKMLFRTVIVNFWINNKFHKKTKICIDNNNRVTAALFRKYHGR